MAKNKGTSLVKFAEYDDEEAAADAKEAKATGGGKMLKLAPGKTVVRAIPSKVGQKHKVLAHQHAVDAPGVGTVFLNCARLMAKQPCAVCKTEQKLLATGNAKDEAKAKRLRAKPRYYMNVIDRGAPENGPRVLAFGKMINDQLVEIRQDPDEGGNYVHPIQGFDLVIRRKGTGQNDTEYAVTCSKVRPKPLHEDAVQMNEWIEGQHNLSSHLTVLTLPQQEAKLRGEDIEDADEGRPPRRGASRRASEDVDDIKVEDDDDDAVDTTIADDDEDED